MVDWGNATSTTQALGTPPIQVSGITGNDTKDIDITARAKWHLPLGGEASISYMTARRDHWYGVSGSGGASAATWYDQTCWTPAVRYCLPMHLNVMAEYYNGKILDTPSPDADPNPASATPGSLDNNGGYFQIDYTPGLNRATPFFRWEEWNAPIAKGTRTCDYLQDTLGCAYNTTKQNRYTLEWDSIHDNNGKVFNNFGLQWQFAYGS
jgi:hypothetical protein